MHKGLQQQLRYIYHLYALRLLAHKIAKQQLDMDASLLMQVLALIPVSQFLGSLYGAHPGLCNVLIDTVFSLAAALFAFVILPAGDFIIGQEPPEAVSAHSATILTLY